MNVKLFNEGSKISVKLGHSIVNRKCRINVGELMAAYGGGGHRGAGACRLEPLQAAEQLSEIIEILEKNIPKET